MNEFVWRREWSGGGGGVFLVLMDSTAVDCETVCSGLWPAAAALQASPLQLKRKRACCAGGTGRSGGGCSDVSRVRWRRKWEAEKSPHGALRGLGPWHSQTGTDGNKQQHGLSFILIHAKGKDGWKCCGSHGGGRSDSECLLQVETEALLVSCIKVTEKDNAKVSPGKSGQCDIP